MKFIEIKGVTRERRFINLDRVNKVILKQTGEIMLEPMMEGIEPGDKNYKKMLQILGIPGEQPASGMSELEEE